MERIGSILGEAIGSYGALHLPQIYEASTRLPNLGKEVYYQQALQVELEQLCLGTQKPVKIHFRKNF